MNNLFKCSNVIIFKMKNKTLDKICIGALCASASLGIGILVIGWSKDYKSRLEEHQRLKSLSERVMQKAQYSDGEKGFSFKDAVKLAEYVGYEGVVREGTKTFVTAYSHSGLNKNYIALIINDKTNEPFIVKEKTLLNYLNE